MLRAALLTLLALSSAATGQLALPPTGAPAFPAPTVPTTEWFTRTALATDFNSDGYPDILDGWHSLQLSVNNGHGLFLPAGTLLSAWALHETAAADFDGDGHVDVVGVGNDSGPQDGVDVWRSLGDGQFSHEASFIATDLTSVTVSDVDKDGALDVVCGHSAAGGLLSLLHGDGQGGFSPPAPWVPGSFAVDVAAADFDHDGDEDFVVAGSFNMQLVWSDGAGGFTLGPTYVSQAGGTLAVGDADGDGWADIACGVSDIAYRRNNSGSFPFAPTTVWSGTGVGPIDFFDPTGTGKTWFVGAGVGGNLVTVEFQTAHGLPGVPVKYPLPGATATRVVTSDFDGDGREDVLLAAYHVIEPRLSVFLTGANGQPAVPPLVKLAPTMVDPRALAVGDLDADGHPDLVLLDGSASDPHLVVGKASSPTSYALSSQPTLSETLWNLDLSDLNGDGALDASFVNFLSFAGPSSLVVHLGNGAAGFGSQIATSIPTLLHTYDAEEGDFDGDGALDIAVLASDISFIPALEVVRIWHGLGNGQFTPAGAMLFSPGVSGRLAVGDADGDGDLDAVAALDGKSLHLVRGDGAGGLQSALNLLQDSDLREGVVARDVDADGALDVATGWSGEASLALLAGLGGGAFAAPQLGGFPEQTVHALDCGDLDGDGALDFAQTTEHGGVLIVVPTNGAGALRPATAYTSGDGFSTEALGLADLNADGRTDVLVLGESHDLVSVHLATGGTSNAWISLGGGVPGAAGQPRARGTGQPVGSQLVHYEVEQAAPNAATTIVLGTHQTALPFKGGLLVPAPDLLASLGLTSAQGTLSLAAPWPDGVPAGFELWLQTWIVDPSAAHGLSATGGLRLLVP